MSDNSRHGSERSLFIILVRVTENKHTGKQTNYSNNIQSIWDGYFSNEAQERPKRYHLIWELWRAEKSILSRYKGPEAGMSLVCLRNGNRCWGQKRENDAQEVKYEREKQRPRERVWILSSAVEDHWEILKQCSHIFSSLKLRLFKPLFSFRGKC